MKIVFCLVAIIACLAWGIMPAAAMTSESLDITISQDGSADIQFTYHLNWIEYISVYLRLVDPAQELKKVLESNFHKPVQVIGVDSGSVHLWVDSFANVTRKDHETTVRTPALSFAEGEEILKNYWFAPLVSVDLSPSVTTIGFPDGFVATFHDAQSIPSQVHSW